MNIPKVNDLLDSLKISQETKSFETVVDLSGFWDRQLLLGDIEPAVGEAIESLIRFWNRVDDENNVPIEKRAPIKIYIDSNGGDLDATFTMIDAISLSKTPVWTINIGCAYSGGFFTFIAGHKRFTYPHGTFLYHEGYTGTAADRM